MSNEQLPELTCEEKLEAAHSRILELEQALRKEITFRTAREMQEPKIWLPVMSLVEIFHEAYTIRNKALANNKSNTRLMFTTSNEGRIVGVQSEEEEEVRPSQ